MADALRRLPRPTKTFHRDTYPAINPEQPKLSNAGKSVIITGGGTGIGGATARSFAASGASPIIILGRTHATLLKCSKAITTEFPKVQVHTFVADIVDKPGLKKAFLDASAAIGGKIDILIANAGTFTDHGAFLDPEHNEDNWTTVIEVNILGTYNTIRAFAPVAAEHASVVYISTALWHLPSRKDRAMASSLSVSKVGASKMIEALWEEKKESWTVINVHPGVVLTELYKKAKEAGHFLDEDAVELPADFIVWALSKEADFLNGKFLWCNWDVEELKAAKDKFSGDNYSIGLLGWSAA